MVNLVDIILVLIVLSGLLAGWHRGFIVGSLDLVRWVGSLLIALHLYPYVANWLGIILNSNNFWILPVSFFMVTMLASVLIHFLFNLLLERLPQNLHHHKSNRVLGLVPGMVSGLATVTIIVLLLFSVPLPEAVETRIQESPVVSRLSTFTDLLDTALQPAFDDVAQRSVSGLKVVPGSRESIELPFTVTNAKPRPNLEAKMLELLNKEREAHGLKPLVYDTLLREVARQHSADMFSRGYFSHYSPEGHDAFDRIRVAGIPFRVAGENLALAPSLSIAHDGLMKSPGHRANILQPRFGRVGIGVMEGGKRRLMITQKFRN